MNSVLQEIHSARCMALGNPRTVGLIQTDGDVGAACATILCRLFLGNSLPLCVVPFSLIRGLLWPNHDISETGFRTSLVEEARQNPLETVAWTTITICITEAVDKLGFSQRPVLEQ